MSEHEETHEETGLRLIIEIDQFAGDSPVEGSESVKFAVLHRNYVNPCPDLNSSEAIDAFERANRGPRSAWVVFSLYMMDHSNTTYRAGVLGHGNPFGGGVYAQFDSGRVGIIALKRTDYGDPASRRAGFDFKACADAVCATYTAWANGENYEYSIEDEDGETVESCSGYVGDYDGCLEAGRAALATAAHFAMKARAADIALDIAASRPDLAPA
jgi:hypothetical protein